MHKKIGPMHSYTSFAKVIEYFSDRCGQYRNYKNFLNLTYYKHDFSILQAGLSLQQAMGDLNVMKMIKW